MESEVGVKCVEKIIWCNCNGIEAEVSNVEKESGNWGNVLLQDLESCLEDIDDRLMISRMVNDSVIKGMVNAVEQEAAERIAAKELEVAHLKESLRLHPLGADKIGCLELLVKENDPASMSCGSCLSYSDASGEHDKVMESVESLKIVASELFMKLKKEIDDARGCTSIKRTSSGSELVGLGGLRPEKECESCVHVDKRLYGSKETVDDICTQLNDILQMSKISLRQWQQEREFQGKVEAIVMQSSIWSLQEEFEEKLRNQNASFSCNPSVNWHEKFDQISGLRTELDRMFELLSNSENGQLISPGSHDMDNSHPKAQGNRVISLASLCQENRKMVDSKVDIPESFDAAQLKHLTKHELVSFFNSIITMMRRDHESIMQKKTEEYFSLKREYLNQKERGSSSQWKDNKEVEPIRKKILDVIMKLDKILVEYENLPALLDNAEILGNLKDRLDNLHSENRQLKVLLSDKKNEVNCPTSQIYGVAEKMFQHSLAESNMLKVIANLNSTIEDSRIEAAINELINKSFLKELSKQMECETEESNMEFVIAEEIYDTIFREVAVSPENINRCNVENLDIESLIVQEICGLIFKETIKDEDQKLKELYSRYQIENKKSISCEKNVLEKENQLRVNFEEKERLRQDMLTLEALLQKKETLAGDLSVSLAKDREQFERLSEELNSVREQASRQQTIASEKTKECESVRYQLGDALQQIEEYEVKICKLHQMLEFKAEELMKADEQREALLALSEERHNKLSLVDAKEKELRKQMEAVVLSVQGLSKLLADFECKVAWSIKTNTLRLEDSCFQLASLIKKANSLRRTGLMYKQRLERRCVDLQMAETEVDLLGDKVDVLLGLLGKIYIALDHYSPILQYYPGIMEILKLVRREMSGELTKTV